ncbi:MAG TPA: DUF58 domain-containing protein [Candidatus Dormibacteraeota bacterium]|nr:DUF58 domain-containing protein [Candidatus Dormibacteraeota bacterium]
MIPTARVAGAVGLFLALTFFAATSEVTWLFLLALWLLALIPAAFVYAAWNRRGVTVSLAVHQSRPGPGSPAEELRDPVLRRSPHVPPLFEGDAMGLEIGFRARRGRRGPAWATGEIGGRPIGVGTGVVTADGRSVVRWADTLPRGAVQARGWRLGTGDPLGLFAGSRNLPDAEVALVLPKFASLAERRETREVEASVPAPRAGSGSELFGVREYRAGDSLRRIHWRASARHGQLVVREYEPPGVQTLAISVDPRPPSAEIADQVARIAASEAWDCLRDGGRVELAGVLETRDIWEVLEWLARYPAVEFGDAQAADVVITADPALLRPGARRNWLVGDAHAEEDVGYERVGTAWPI